MSAFAPIFGKTFGILDLTDVIDNWESSTHLQERADTVHALQGRSMKYQEPNTYLDFEVYAAREISHRRLTLGLALPPCHHHLLIFPLPL